MKISKVKLSQIPSSRNQIIILTLIVFVLFGYCVGEYFLHFYFFDDMRDDQAIITTYRRTSVTNRQGLYNAQQYAVSGDPANKKSFTVALTTLYTTIDILYNLFPDKNKNR